MLFFKVIILVFYCVQYSHTFNLTEKIDEIIIPERFASNIRKFIYASDDTITKQCKQQLIQYGKALGNFELWALLMLDAGTKIPSGILGGNLVGLGNFDQCLKIESPPPLNKIYGKYCLGEIPLSGRKGTKSVDKVWQLLSPQINQRHEFEIPETRMLNRQGLFTATFAICLPASCSTSDIQALYSWIGINIRFDPIFCQTKASQPKLTSGDIATISFLSVIFCIMLGSSLYDVYLFYFNKKPAHIILLAFSVVTNGRKLIATTKSSNQISCLHGIRVISMMWVILCHRYSLVSMLPKLNSFYAFEWVRDGKNMFIMGGTISVDTFFVLGGLLVSYGFMCTMKPGQKFNIFVFYLHRYLRLTPLLAVIMLMYVTIIKHFGSGPLWNHVVSMLSSTCNKYWWSSLLYVQNYVNNASMCVGQTWYLAVDTQLFLLSPIILIPLRKFPSVALLIAIAGILISILASFFISWVYEIHGLIVANLDSAFNQHYYYATHTRAAPWLIGLILGYYIYKIKQEKIKVPMNKAVAVCCWAISLAILCACVFCGHNTLTQTYDRLGNAFFIALLRPGWSVALSWVIMACFLGYGGPINWFLSLPVFQVVSKLTYSMYLIHFSLILLIAGQMRQPPHFSNLQMLYTFWGDFMFTIASALVLTLAFESPIIVIEKIIFGNAKETKQKPKENDIQLIENA